MVAKAASNGAFRGLLVKGISGTRLPVGGSGRRETARAASARIANVLPPLAKGRGGGAGATAKGRAGCVAVRLAAGSMGRGTTSASPVSIIMAAAAVPESRESGATAGGLSGVTMAAITASISRQKSAAGCGRVTVVKTKRSATAMAVGVRDITGRVPVSVSGPRGLEGGRALFRSAAIVGLPTAGAISACRLQTVRPATIPTGVRRSAGERRGGGKVREMESGGPHGGRVARAARLTVGVGSGHGAVF